jgi:hypothetical protein
MPKRNKASMAEEGINMSCRYYNGQFDLWRMKINTAADKIRMKINTAADKI